MKRYLLILILICTAFTPVFYINASTTTGFIPGQIWYSKDSLVEGETVKIYAAVWNGDKYPLSAKVTFYDKNVILGSRDIVVLSEQLKDVSISWQVTSGDHTISAKITSSSLTTSDNKKESIVLDHSTTTVDNKFVPVVIKTSEGKTASSSDILQSQIDKASSTIGDVLPAPIAQSISNTFGTVDDFRDNTLSKINTTKNETQKEIDSFNKSQTPVKSDKVTNSDKANAKEVSGVTVSSNGVDKPIAYIKFFIFSALAFIFSSKLVFYGAIILVVFYLIRFIFRKV